MQNAKCRMQNAERGAAAFAFCILHFAFCISFLIRSYQLPFLHLFPMIAHNAIAFLHSAGDFDAPFADGAGGDASKKGNGQKNIKDGTGTKRDEKKERKAAQLTICHDRVKVPEKCDRNKRFSQPRPSLH